MGKAILLIDDNGDDVHLTVRALRRAFKARETNYDIVVAHDGVEALGTFFGSGPFSNRQGVLPALILLDLKMPKLSGLEVLQCFRYEARTKSIPIFILTSSRAELDEEDSYGLGADGYLHKPLDPEAFFAALEELNGKKQVGPKADC